MSATHLVALWRDHCSTEHGASFFDYRHDVLGWHLKHHPTCDGPTQAQRDAAFGKPSPLTGHPVKEVPLTEEVGFMVMLTEDDLRRLADGETPPWLPAYARLQLAKLERERNPLGAVPAP